MPRQHGRSVALKTEEKIRKVLAIVRETNANTDDQLRRIDAILNEGKEAKP
jgi:hypothetical protein